ncbi:tripartite tricarboxylate transporter permease [Fertoebacter nigrum]|uniref:Tripartite tricarboxylate transporter permease n=1 Tax=Fertoeibacter niger TaxID=2656921 RepID=A0A8X8GX20_9RHOB|nr:tripartite tricarboxylate transporter permease [Fertoeibacter niger]NUB45888.1 tripartite tricarboxylate transporter permease [Fertoeibacter niger]
MEFMLVAAGEAFLQLMSLERMGWLAVGVFVGLIIGIIPGLGGVSALALLLPFTFGMDPYSAIALLLGMGAVTTTGDSIPAILFGVPGTSAAQATCIDGYAMAKKGEAGRALSAAYTASMIGGIFGAFVLGISIPILRPIMLQIGAPELLAFSVFGISMVAVLSGRAPLIGVAVAGMGVMLAMIGSDPQGGELRWTLGTLYLFDGMPLLPFALGVFALPELVDLAIKRTSVSQVQKFNVREGMWQGVKDTFSHKWLIFKCSTLGTIVGAIPGLGSSVVDWFAYGFAARTEKDAKLTFGTGDVRGVLAPESAANAKEGGSLVPTIAFGVPGSASMAILLGAFMIHGLQPGPEMVTKNLDITYAMVWSIALANILGAGTCFLLSGQFAKIATLRWTLTLPLIMSVLMIGAYQGQGAWGDLYTLLIFGVIGWVMKQMKWPRPPLILGFVLGDLIERYMFISTMRYGTDWLFKPLVVILLTLSVIGLFRPAVEEYLRKRRLGVPPRGIQPLKLVPGDAMHMVLIVVICWMLWQATLFNDFESQVAPFVVGGIALTLISISFANRILRRPDEAPADDGAPMHMDMVFDGDQPRSVVLRRAATFFGWLIGFMLSMAVFGYLPTVPVFILAFMWSENREALSLRIKMAVGVTLFLYVMFEAVLGIRWPDSVIGGWFPSLAALIPSM